jgi:hypothetical protein
MADIAIILDNVGNNIYSQNSREYLTNPIKVDLMKVLLSTAEQIYNVIKIRNAKSVGTQSNRDISLQNYIGAMDKTNLIVDVPLDPPIILDGQTSFQTLLAANSEMDLLFYFDQTDIGNILQ